ncbi:unnamed protein product [Orchesella dallaii]|uniref:Uncharacterized protein n=1 Tax=Orchesella dallaii TaxID=48710 RepID=A0ABP1S0Y0_9HEXA
MAFLRKPIPCIKKLSLAERENIIGELLKMIEMLPKGDYDWLSTELLREYYDHVEEQCFIFYSLYNNRNRIMNEMFAVATRQVRTLLNWKRPYPGMIDQARGIIHEIFWVSEIRAEYE